MKRSTSTLARALLDVLERQAAADDVSAQKVLQEMNMLIDKATEKPVAEIRSAHELSEKTLKKITSFLKKKLNKKELEIKVTVDSGILGGFVARVGEQEFDFSIRSTLKSLQTYV